MIDEFNYGEAVFNNFSTTVELYVPQQGGLNSRTICKLTANFSEKIPFL